MKTGRTPAAQTFAEKVRQLAAAEPDFRRRYSDDEIGAMFGVSRQRVHQVLGPYAGARRKPRLASVEKRHSPSPDSLLGRLRALEEAEPDFADRYTFGELAERFGVSSQRVQQVLGPRRRGAETVKSARAARRLRDFVQAHRDAVRPLRDGGMKLAEIAREAGISYDALRRLWGELGLPSRAADGLGDRRVLRQETCVACGRAFDWTAQRARNRRQGVAKFVVCGTACGRRHGQRQALAHMRRADRRITIADASARYGLSRSQLQRLIAGGHVKGQKVAGVWMLDLRSVERYRARPATGAPSQS